MKFLGPLCMVKLSRELWQYGLPSYCPKSIDKHCGRGNCGNRPVTRSCTEMNPGQL